MCRVNWKNKQAEYKYFVFPPDSFFVWSSDLTDLPLKMKEEMQNCTFSAKLSSRLYLAPFSKPHQKGTLCFLTALVCTDSRKAVWGCLAWWARAVAPCSRPLALHQQQHPVPTSEPELEQRAPYHIYAGNEWLWICLSGFLPSGFLQAVNSRD